MMLDGGEGIVAFRVAEIQDNDDFGYLKENAIHELGIWMESEFGDSEVFYDLDEAWSHAWKVYEEAGYIEHGVYEINAKKYNFPGC